MKRLNKILLIDDSDASNELNSYCLNKMNVCDEILIAKNGEEAIDLLEESEELPELIFLDIRMPVMGGFDFLEEYEFISNQDKKAVIIVLTASSSPLDIKDAELTGKVTAYYVKPLDEKKIEKIFGTYFN